MTFKTNELISSTKLVRNFGTVLGKMKNRDISKIWILRNNNLEAVMLSRKAYDKIIECIENLEDASLIKERMTNDDWTRYTHEEMMKKFSIDLNSL